MTISPSEFVINWATPAPESDNPPTVKEMRDLLARIQDLIQRVTSAKEIINTSARTQVARAVMEGINNTGTASAMLDIGEEPTFIPEKGGYHSIIYVAQNEAIMKNFIDHF